MKGSKKTTEKQPAFGAGPYTTYYNLGRPTPITTSSLTTEWYERRQVWGQPNTTTTTTKS